MPSTYSPSLKLELIGNGEQAGTWGTTTNTNLGTLLEQAITGVLPITLTGDVTLTDYNGLSDQARNAVLIFNGLLGAPCNVIAPPSQKVYIIRNRANATVTIKTTSGNGISIANAGSEVVFCDGTDFYSATAFNYINGNLTVTGNVAIGASLTVAANATFGATIFGNSSTSQWYLPTGDTASRASSGQNGILRYNSELAIYEGYTGGTWVRFQTYPQGVYGISYLIIAGGGAGGYINSFGGGGGGGGYIASSLSVTPGATYTMVIGGGGTGAGGAGTNSSITGVNIASGGGAGGQAGSYAGGGNGYSGGSGGGGGSYAGGESGAGGAGVSGQGNNGGNGSTYAGGGGGGGGAIGGDAGPNGPGGTGGIGYLSTITGSAVYYGGGGGGGNGGAGSSGGGGSANNNGSINTGGGAGAGTTSGGSGVIVVSIPTVSYSGVTTGGPTVTISGANTILKYTSSGTYTA